MSVGIAGCRRTCVWCLWWFLLLASVARFAEAQESVAPDSSAGSQPAAGEFSLAGTVVNSITGEPLRRAAVQISGGPNGNLTLTDDAGHFLIEGLAKGHFLVNLMKPGFYESEIPGAGSVEVGRDSGPVILKMTPQGVIKGTVTTRDGQPLEGFRIGLISKEIVDGQAMWVERGNQGATNEDGEFRLTGLKAGHYYVSVDQSERTTLAQRGVANAREQGYAKVFYPGVSEVGAASPIEVNAGREAETNFTLTAEPVYQVSGVVGGQISGLTFTRKAGNEGDFRQMVGAEDGKFQVQLPAGAYVVTGTTQDGTGSSTPGASVVISSDNADLHVALTSKASIPVRIVTEHYGAGGGRTVAPEGGIPGLRMQLLSNSGMFQMSRWWRGRFEIDDVAAGTYTLDIHGAGEWWVKSVQCGGVDLLNEDLTVTEGGQPAPIEITLRDDAGAVTGTVTGVAQESAVSVLLVQARGKKNYVEPLQRVTSNFGFTGVAPGDYAVVAIDHGEQLEYSNPEVLNPYLSGAQQIHVPARGTVTVNLSLTTAGR